MQRRFTILTIILAITACLLTACREDQLSNDPQLCLTLSCDTLRFDTVFTSIGSATAQVMLYNPNSNALRINRFWIQNGQYFHVNIDGETQPERLHDIDLRGGDSLYIFVRVNIDPRDTNNPFYITDALHIAYNDRVLDLHMEAYGQDAIIIRSPKLRRQYAEYNFGADRPYLIYDTVLITGTTHIDRGARLYMHPGSSIYAYGDVMAQGTVDEPIIIRSDRRDELFDTVPYLYAAGGWGGLFLINDTRDGTPQYNLDHVDILSGNVGLYCYNEHTDRIPHLSLHNSRIHNHAIYGLALQNVDADVVNTEISNAASYCVYLSGGTHRFTHTTVASYFRWTNVAIQSATRDTVAAVYIDNLSKTGLPTRTSFVNSIITGLRRNNLMLATPLPQYYAGEFIGCYLKADSLSAAAAHHNRYYHDTDSANVFVNNFYAIDQRTRYYDFRLDSLSPARGIAIADTTIRYPLDRNEHARTLGQPDAGCYTYTPY